MSFGSSDKVRTAIGRRSDPAPSLSSSLNASREKLDPPIPSHLG